MKKFIIMIITICFGICLFASNAKAQETKTKSTIWIYGDSTVCNYENVTDDQAHGWGQFFENYIDQEKYDVRNMAMDGMSAKELATHESFAVSESYGKSGDLLILSLGIYDYAEEDINETMYTAAITDMVKRAKAKGMKVYLVKQQGVLDDCIIYPVTKTKWYNDSLDGIGKSEKVEVIDLYTEWLVYCLENHYTVARDLYLKNELQFNRKGADKLAKMMAELIFPKKMPEISVEEEDEIFQEPSTIVYETEVSGGPVPNPHKGFVLTTYIPEVFTSNYEYGPGGSKDNHAWDVVTICNGVHYWKDINPKEGVYNWKEIDDNIEAAWSRGMTYVIRILPYSHLEGSHDNYGEEHNLVPKWVFDKGAKKKRVSYLEEAGVEFDVPVWDDPVYLKACKSLATALAEHYDGDPRVELIDIRPFGDWGEWHFSSVKGSEMPSVKIQKDMIKHYSDAFDKTMIAITSDAYGEVYDYALSLGVAKRNDGMIGIANEEWNLRLSYKANIPALSENAGTYSMMLKNPDGPKGPLKWTPNRFRECIEISHMTLAALDQDSECGYKIYREQKEVIDEMVNRIGYNFTVTSAKRNGNKLQVKIKNTGVAPCYFDINLCAELTDAKGNKLENFGKPIRIEKGTFHDEDEKTYVFEYSGIISSEATICLAIYESDNPLTAGKNPTVRFDNKNSLDNNRLKLGEYRSPNVHQHAGKKVAKENATCTKAGVKAYYKCSCGKFYFDADCTKEIADLDKWKTGEGKIAMKAHTLKTTITRATTSENGKKVTKCSICGKVTKKVVINQIKSVTLSKTAYVYNGKTKKPAVAVKDSKGKAIATSNYSVKYADGRKNVGKYNVKITFKGDYKGSKSLTFTINPKATTLKSVTAASKTFTAKWTKQTTQVDGYEVEYALDKNFTSSAKKVVVTKNTTTSKKISSLKSKKTYYVRVRTYKKVGTKKYYSDWSKVLNVKTK